MMELNMSLVSLENSSIFLTANGQVFKFADNEYYPTKNGVSVCYLNVDGIFNSEKLYLSCYKLYKMSQIWSSFSYFPAV